MMQGRQDPVNTFSESVNIDQGSLHSNTDVNSPSLLNDIFSAVDDTRPSYTVTSIAPTNGPTHDAPPYSFWNSGETSSRAQNMFESGVKMDSGRPSYGVHAGCNSESEERLVQEVDMLLPRRPNSVQGVNQLRNQPRFLQGSNSSSSGRSENLYESYMSRRGSYGPVIGPNVDSNFYRLDGVEREHTSNAKTFPGTAGCLSGSSSYMVVEDDDVSSPSVVNWGLSCKRKALEGTSGGSYCVGGSSNFQQIENGVLHSSISNNDASSSLSLSTPTQDCPRTTDNLNLGVGITVSADCTTSNAQTIAVSGNESLPFSFPSTASSSYTLGIRNEPHRFSPFDDYSRQLAAGTTLSSPISRPSMSHSSPPRNRYPLPWNVHTNSSAGNSFSFISPAERGVVPCGEANRSILPRPDLEHPLFAPLGGMRNAEHDPVGWILASGNVNSSGSFTSSIRARSSSSIISPIPWASSEPSPQNQQRQEEFASWSLFPSIDFESGARIDHFLPLSSGTSAQETVASSSSSSHDNAQQNWRSAYLLERQGDDAPVMPRSLRSLAADIEGRHRLISEIRQVLNAMRRGENIRLEDYVPFEPFPIHEMGEWHDRHRGMRLDVDNMSYEELLALGERIGDVSTGLSEESITELMKQQKYVSGAAGSSPPEVEPCSICQEEYSDGDELGRLNCGHDFHTDCIKQWVMQKNQCPICKETALAK